MYGPKSRRRRAKLWEAISATTKDGQWVIVGDFNTMERWIDSSGPFPLLKGREKEKWRLLQNRFGLMDAFDILGGASRSRFTRRGLHGTRLDQSRIDRVYCLDLGWWPFRFVGLCHVHDRALLDHDPVCLSLQIFQDQVQRGGSHKSTPFIINPEILKDPVFLEELRSIWKEDIGVSDPRTRFSLAMARI